MRPLVKYINKGLLTNTPIHLLHIQEKGEKIQSQKVGMDRIAVLPDIRPTRYPANFKTGYRISGRIFGGCRIPDIRPDTGYFRHMINYTKILKELKQIIF